jgi:chromosome segregation ATPase
MATQVQTVGEAQAALEAAKAEALKQRVENAKKELKLIRAAAKQLRAEHAQIMRQIAECDRIVSTGRGEIALIDAEIAARCAPLPDILAEPEDFAEEIALLRAQRAEVIERMKRAENGGFNRSRPTEIAFEFERLKFAANNLVSLIENGGQTTNGWKDELRYVG